MTHDLFERGNYNQPNLLVLNLELGVL